MNRAIIIVMMDFLISSFLLFMDVGDGQTPQYQLNSRTVPYEQNAAEKEQPVLVTDADVEEHFVEVFKDAYLESLQADIAVITSKMERQEEYLTRQLSDSQSELAKSEGRNRELDAALTEKDKENAGLKERVSEDESRIASLGGKILKAEARIHDLEDESIRLHADYDKQTSC